MVVVVVLMMVVVVVGVVGMVVVMVADAPEMPVVATVNFSSISFQQASPRHRFFANKRE